MRQITTAVVMLWLTAALSGCATIMSGDFQEVSFNSSPSGVEIYKEGDKLCVTPCNINLPRAFPSKFENGKEVLTPPLILVAKKDGYEDQKISLPVGMNPWMWVDVIFSTGLVGITSLAVDGRSPPATQYEPDKYFVTLTPVKASQAERAYIVKQIRLRNFVLTSHANLQSDLARGGGEYVDSLKASVSWEGTTITLAELRQLSLRYPTVPAFAEAIVERFYAGEEPY